MLTTDNCSSKVIVGTGWWSSGQRTAQAIGDDLTRSPAFFKLWYRQVSRYLNPYRIFVTDSCSPFVPSFEACPEIVWVSLDKNYGHAADIAQGKVQTKYCGFTRSVLLGAMYALSCDADYYVYVEQDCLIRGHNILLEAISDATSDILIGQRTQGGRGFQPDGSAAPMYQQSFMVVARSGLERFISSYFSNDFTDGELSPEIKMEQVYFPFSTVNIPYGRSRPIDFSLSHFYAQHLTFDELCRFMEAEELDLKEWFAQSAYLGVGK